MGDLDQITWEQYSEALGVQATFLRQQMGVDGKPNGPVAEQCVNHTITCAGDLVKAWDDGVVARQQKDMAELERAVVETWVSAAKMQLQAMQYLIATGTDASRVIYQLASEQFGR